MNFAQWKESIDGLKNKDQDFQKKVFFELYGNSFIVNVDEKNSFKAELEMTTEELSMVKKFIEESDTIYKKEVADARFRAINKNLSSM